MGVTKMIRTMETYSSFYLISRIVWTVWYVCAAQTKFGISRPVVFVPDHYLLESHVGIHMPVVLWYRRPTLLPDA